MTDFYAAVRSTGISGAPDSAQAAAIAPFVSDELADLLRKARALRDTDLARAPDEKPAFAEGDLFTSLFEGHTSLEIVSDSSVDATRRIAIRFTYDRTPPPVSWTDLVIVRTERGRTVVADVVYGGDWAFASQGSLVASLKASLEPDPAEPAPASTRDGLALVLQLTDSTVRLLDDTTSGDSYVRHQYAGRVVGTDFHLIHLSFVEGQSYRLIHATTGRQVAVDAPPVWSPDKTRMVTTSMDLVATFDPTRIAVLRIEGDTAHVEWQLEPELWGPAAAHWVGNDTIRFTANHVTSAPGTYRESEGLLVRTAKGWALQQP